MGLYERLTNEQSPRIPVHTLSGVVGELERGKISTSQAVAVLGLNAGEEAEATTLLANVIPPREAVSMGGFAALANVGSSYDATSASQGLGIALVQTAGISQVIFGVRVNKIGSGTQSWQLWNETDSAQVGVIDDAGATGVKLLSTTVNFDPALGAGLKTLRVRCKSTTAADDPVYFGATLSLRRFSLLTALELHEVLLYAEATGMSATALKTRLGV